MVTYDGSRRAAGARIYVDGKPQPVDVDSDSLRDTMRTHVPLTIAQRHTTARIDGVALQDLRIYGRKLSGRGGRATGLVEPPGGDLEETGRQAEQGREPPSCSSSGSAAKTSRYQAKSYQALSANWPRRKRSRRRSAPAAPSPT